MARSLPRNLRRMASHFHHGTSSWSEKSWLGPFYPPGSKPADYLTHYATQFTTVERDATYYRVPTPCLHAIGKLGDLRA
jgi:Protein of unknown function DUF72